MRLHLQISKSSKVVPFSHAPVLVGALHKWLGQNGWHNHLSLHSFSWLKGAERGNGGFIFPRGASWFISAYSAEFLKKLIQGIQHDPAINYGLEVKSIAIQEDPEFNDSQQFTLASPVLIKRREGERVKHYVFSDTESNKYMTETLVTKLSKVGLDANGVEVKFAKDYPSPKTKLVTYNGIGNKASMCPITINGTPEQLAFAWNVGIGNSTGIGFGALN